MYRFSFLPLLILSAIFDLRYSQDLVWVKIGSGTSCTGEAQAEEYGFNYKYNLTSLYYPSGNYKTSGFYGNETFRFSVCGGLSVTTCDGDWCFESVARSNNSDCVQGLANWEETVNTSIIYYAVVNESEANVTFAVHILIDQINNNAECDYHGEVNYNILCDNTTAGVWTSLYANDSECIWNISGRSSVACLEVSLIPYSPNNNNDHDDLSGGTIFLIIVLVLVLLYLILGCTYNSFYHGRAGLDAVPNKSFWLQFGRYINAGCEVTRDCLCCGKPSSQYQEI